MTLADTRLDNIRQWKELRANRHSRAGHCATSDAACYLGGQFLTFGRIL